MVSFDWFVCFFFRFFFFAFVSINAVARDVRRPFFCLLLYRSADGTQRVKLGPTSGSARRSEREREREKEEITDRKSCPDFVFCSLLFLLAPNSSSETAPRQMKLFGAVWVEVVELLDRDGGGQWPTKSTTTTTTSCLTNAFPSVRPTAVIVNCRRTGQ